MHVRYSVIFVLVTLLGFGAYAYVVRQQSIEQRANIPEDTSFAWGIYTNVFGLSDSVDDPFKPESIPAQIDAIKALGVQYVRTNYEWADSSVRDKINDAWLNALTDAGFRPVVVLDLPFNTYDEAYASARSIAARYPKIQYYQLLNELSGSVKPGFSGLNESDYRIEEFARVEQVTRGLAEGIRSGNSGAQRIVSANWLGVAIIDKVIRVGIPFEIVGWNWFSDMGDNPAAKQLEDGTILNIPVHFTAQGKRFWIMEANRQGGSVGNELNAQRSYLENFATTAYANPDISGFFAFKLTDGQDVGSRQAAWGIYTTKRVLDGKTQSPDGYTFAFGPLKPAGEAYRLVVQRSLANKLPRSGTE